MTEDRQDNQGIRLTSLLLVICLNLLLSIFFVAGRFPRQQRLSQNSLEDRINPNTASVASLARLPGVGRVKAQAIVSYRQKILTSGKDVKAFKDASQLDKVYGIGPKTVEDIREFLKFE